jgi:hypothetical protein
MRLPRLPLWAGVLVNGLIGMAAIAALIFVLVTGARLKHVERTITTIHREIVRIEEVVPGTTPHGRPGPAWAVLTAPALPAYCCTMHDLSQRAVDETPPEPEIVTPANLFGGVWANAVQMQRTEYELTIDFIRVGPQGKQAMLVSRVNLPPALLGQLAELVAGQQAVS